MRGACPPFGLTVIKFSYTVGLLIVASAAMYHFWPAPDRDAPIGRSPRSVTSASRTLKHEGPPSSNRESPASHRVLAPTQTSNISEDTAKPSDDVDILAAVFDSAERDRELERELTRNNDAFANDPPDRRWAAAAEVSLGEDLQTVPGAEVLSLECRTTFCKAVLRFDSYAEAREASSGVAQLVYKENCAVEVFTLAPETHDVGSPYEHEVFFDCTDLRIAGVP